MLTQYWSTSAATMWHMPQLDPRRIVTFVHENFFTQF